MSNLEVYEDLKNCGCCSRCCIRFLGEKFGNYEEPEQTIKNLLGLHSNEEQVAKKLRSNPCIVCLGVLEDTFVDNLLQHECWSEVEQFDSETFKINFTLPPNILIRHKSMEIHIKNKFPEYFKENNLGDIMLLPLVFKLSFKSKLDKHCGKKYDVHSGLQLWITLNHENNDEEVKILHIIDHKTYKNRKYLADKMFSKTAVSNSLSTISVEKLMENIDVPPKIPSNPAQIVSITFESSPIYIAGRYCKYSRNLWQTPWNLNSTTEDIYIEGVSSVQDVIFNGMNKVFGFPKEKLTFTASGREDLDVRCLGKGRPFFIKIDSVRKDISKDMFRRLEETVNLSSDVAVFDMQQTDKNSIKNVKFGEEMKKKAYNALCIIRGSKCIAEVVQKINEIGKIPLMLNQKTPIRVSHRRALSDRKKQIFSMKASEVPGSNQLFQISLITQAGTYVKEFIHGDFGRTTPSLSDLIEGEVDIFRLDVIGINLDWPKCINSIEHPSLKNFSLWNNVSDKGNQKNTKYLDEDDNVEQKIK